MKYNNIALIGAGAVGSYFIYGLNDLEGVSFCLVADGERRERLLKEGVTINDQVYYPAVKTPEEARGADLLFVSTKYQALPDCLDMIETIVDDHTVVLSLLNGIDSEEIIAERIGMEHIVYSVMRIQSERRDGKVRFNPETTIGLTFGERDGQVTERVTLLAELFERAGLKYFLHQNILKDQWKKYALNISNNLPQAIFGLGFGAYYDSDHMDALRARMYEEVSAVAAAEGIRIGEPADWRQACTPRARFSTLQDLDAGRHTEADMFAGPLFNLAKKHGLTVPYCEFAYHAIKIIEDKNDGKFQY